MTTTELLDRAADLARNSKRVAIVAADSKQREVLRRGLSRRLAAGELEAVTLSTAPPTEPVDEVLVAGSTGDRTS